ncbi:PREDICTED: glutamate-rich WD repeat-containing protein 1 [Nicrophorus vespilloides]|uniref:Glutamate-rich WD repeat-containing protein 1 n=1 Tax=Nicrophorus vespilloides TaxID=110193 RepID=A0ABM1N9L6_NICVS|nr:PREDICTED: glutamate-rich WD repeat-containing protein 1 [Nicrophorus vespilloides]
METEVNEDVVEMMEEDEETNENGEVYLPGQKLEADEKLVCDTSAYVMLHQASTQAPCLSFDIVKDMLGDNREEYPLTCYIAAGTQANKTHANSIIIMKMHNLHKVVNHENEESDSEDDDEEDDDEGEKNPKMIAAFIKHPGCVNRIRTVTLPNVALAATWSELGIVNVWSINEQLEACDSPQLLETYNKKQNAINPLFSYRGHKLEGFALDWCPTAPGVLATGDCKQDLYVWQPKEGGTWEVCREPLVGHTQSIEDIQWSPNEVNVMATCSVDRSIRVWDTRAAPSKACMITCENSHEGDVNVINWNRNEPFILSGGDDGCLKIWDLRQLQQNSPVAIFKHHKAPVTSVEWHPTDSTVFASSGEDNQIAQWDLGVEKDGDLTDVEEIPSQLLFIHQGQENIKEIHWHKQLTSVLISTSLDGFNIFRTISV